MANRSGLRHVLQRLADERVNLVERLTSSLCDREVEISVEEMAHLDEAIADADRAVQQGRLIPADEVFAQIGQVPS